MILTCQSCQSKNRVPASRLTDAAKCAKCKAPLASDVPIVVHTTAEFDELVRDAKVPVLVDYWADWCGPCRMVAPELEKVAKERAGKMVIAKVDTEALPDVAGRFAIRSIPTMILFDAGREQKRLQGAMSKAAILSELGI